MPTTVQFRRGTTAQNNSVTGAAGEITVNTSNNSLRVHDGVNAGGTELATLDKLTTANVSEVTNFYFTNARVYSNVAQLNYATTAYVNSEVANLVNSAPTTLNTLKELADALGSDPNFATSTATLIGNAHDRANTAFTVATSAFDSSNTKVSTVAGVTSATISNVALATGVNQTGILTTANVSEVTNLYFTNARVSTGVSNQTLTNATFTANVVVGGELDVAGNIELRKGFFEFANISATAVTANVTIDLNDSGVVFFTSNATANATVNLRGVGPLVTGNAATYALFMTNGATAYKVNAVQIEGTTSNVTTRWSGGSAPSSGNASNVDVYAFTVIKTAASSYTVFASQTNFG